MNPECRDVFPFPGTALILEPEVNKYTWYTQEMLAGQSTWLKDLTLESLCIWTMRQGRSQLVKDAELQSMDLDLVLQDTESHHRQLLLHFHVKYGAKETVSEHLSRAEGQHISSRCYSGIYECTLPALLAVREQRERGKTQGENWWNERDIIRHTSESSQFIGSEYCTINISILESQSEKVPLEITWPNLLPNARLLTMAGWC